MKPDPTKKPRIVFSTNPEWKPEPEDASSPEDDLPADAQTAEVLLEKRQKGKVVTVVRGIRSHPEGYEKIAKTLKTTCGAGGTVKDREIEVQGDHREKVAAALGKMGYRVKRR